MRLDACRCIGFVKLVYRRLYFTYLPEGNKFLEVCLVEWRDYNYKVKILNGGSCSLNTCFKVLLL